MVEERENQYWGAVTQGGTRSEPDRPPSLALGYYQVIPTGFRFGSLRSRENDEVSDGLGITVS